MTKPMTDGQRTYETKRATKAGMSLDKWLALKARDQQDLERARADATKPPPPPLPADVPTPIRLIAGATHFLLYALMLLQVATGFIGNAAGGIALVWYEVLPIPSPIGPDKALAGLLSNLHLAGAIGLVLLIGGHVTGALYHQFIRRDGLLRRML